MKKNKSVKVQVKIVLGYIKLAPFKIVDYTNRTKTIELHPWDQKSEANRNVPPDLTLFLVLLLMQNRPLK